MFYAMAMSTTATDRQRILDIILGGEGATREFVRSRRSAGRSWRLIERDIYEATGEDVTHETLRSWFPDEPTEAVS